MVRQILRGDLNNALLCLLSLILYIVISTINKAPERSSELMPLEREMCDYELA